MSSTPVGMYPQDRAERERFEQELWRIIRAGDEGGLMLRVLGSLAFQLHCPRYGYLQAEMGRAYTDIDLAGYSRQSRAVGELMASLGYIENQEVSVVSGGQRAIFAHLEHPIHVDVFYDRLDFCHIIPWTGRLEVDAPTIPLAEMLLEKMQIVKLNEKDVVDTIMLLLEHPLGDTDRETINLCRVAELCARDWGLWRTTTMNLDKVRQLVHRYPQLSDEQKAHVAAQVETALARIEAEPKTAGWRLRARLGDRVKWYKEVDEVE